MKLLIIHRTFTNSVLQIHLRTKIYNSYINTCSASVVIWRNVHTLHSQKCELPSYTLPPEVNQGCTLLSGSSSHSVLKCPFHRLFSATFFAILCFLLLISQFKMAPKSSAAALASIPMYKKAAMCPTEKTCESDKLRSG